jgi:methyltransferase (TIGR00027 family)
LGRSRYAEDKLGKAISAGVDQYVIVGAGLDSFALRYRNPESKLKIMELDHPASQESKRKRLSELDIDQPKNLEYIPIDFERHKISDALEKSSFSRERPAFFSWLGTTLYLSHDAIFGTLGSIASFAAPGSEIVFDYIIAKEFLREGNREVLEELQRRLERMGEPLTAFFDPNTFPQEVCNLGFELIENLSPEDQEARYFKGRADGISPINSASYFAHFRVVK